MTPLKGHYHNKTYLILRALLQVSRRAVAKIVQAFDRLHQRNEKISRALKGEGISSGGMDTSTDDSAQAGPIPSLDESVKALNLELQQQNRKISSQNLDLHKKHHIMSLKVMQLSPELDWLLQETNELL